MIGPIQVTCGLNIIQTPTIIYEDNDACVAQVQASYVKSNLTKHINPKFFYAHRLQKLNEVRILHSKSCKNPVDSLTKSSPASSFERCVCEIGMMRLSVGGITPGYTKVLDSTQRRLRAFAECAPSRPADCPVPIARTLG